MSDLTTVTACRAFYPNLQNSNNVLPLVATLISRESEEVRKEIGGVVPYEDCAGTILDGTGTRRQMLPRRPALSVSAVSIDGVTVPQANTPLQPGWRFDRRFSLLILNDRVFPEGLGNVEVDYEAGYAGTQTTAVPASNTPVIIPSENCQGGWAAIDRGVVYANGAALTEVSGNVQAGEYSFANGAYTFNAGDANQVVTMSFNFVPGPIEQAVIEMVGLDLAQRNNPGIKSQAIGDQSTSYEIRGLTPSVKEMLKPYKQTAPTT